MKISEQTATTLVCKRPNLIAHFAAIFLTIIGIGLLVWSLFFAGKIYWLWALLVFVVGLISLLLVNTVTILIDKQLKRIQITTRNLLRGSHEAMLNFDEVREIVIDEQIGRTKVGSSNDSAPREKFCYFLIFQKQNGQQVGIDITPASSTAINGIATDRFVKNNQVMELGNLVASYVGVPCRDKRAATVGEIADVFETIASKISSAKKQK